MTRYVGGCACAAIRYESDVAPQASIHCQCRQCQRATGAGHASLMIFNAIDLSVKGDLKYYDQIADDGSTVSRGFCKNCGSPVLGKSSGYPNIIMIHAASLDDPGCFKPQKVVWSSVKQPWDFIDPALPSY